MQSHYIKELKEVDLIFIEENLLKDWMAEYLEEARFYFLQVWKLQNSRTRRCGDGDGLRPSPYVELDGFVENEEECHCYCCHPHRDWHVEVDVEAAVDLVRPVAAILVCVAEQTVWKATSLTRLAHSPEESTPLLNGYQRYQLCQDTIWIDATHM